MTIFVQQDDQLAYDDAIESSDDAASLDDSATANSDGDDSYSDDADVQSAEANDVIAEAQTPRTVLPRDVSLSTSDAIAAARVCESYRGEDTIVLDLTSITPEFDFFVITTANSRRQMHAIVDEVDRILEHAGHKRKSIEGYENTPWIVQDYGGVVLHVFLPDARELYDLENLWGDAPRFAWQTAE